jgi:hypothetical protein
VTESRVGLMPDRTVAVFDDIFTRGADESFLFEMIKKKRREDVCGLRSQCNKVCERVSVYLRDERW